MDLETTIRTDLWSEICASYEAGDYRNAIINTLRFLTKILREKADSDLDGIKLVGDALGGKNPKLKINKFQTQSEIDEQEGITQILLGLYKGIRNPRSHELIKDSQKEADAIIGFIDYIISLIDKSNPTFTLDGFLTKIFDPDFVENKTYVAALISEVPKKRLSEVLIEAYRGRVDESLEKMELIADVIIPLLSEADLNDYLKVISEDFQKESENSVIISIMNMLPVHLWEKIKKPPKIRIENKLIKSIALGEINLKTGAIRGSKGILGTWASGGYIQYFDLKDELTNVFITKLKDINYEDNLYVLYYFLQEFPSLITNKNQKILCAKAVSRLIKRGEKTICKVVAKFLFNRTDEWRDIFLSELSDLTDPEEPSYYLADGSPFLGKERAIKYEEVVEDDNDIPF